MGGGVGVGCFSLGQGHWKCWSLAFARVDFASAALALGMAAELPRGRYVYGYSCLSQHLTW